MMIMMCQRSIIEADIFHQIGGCRVVKQDLLQVGMKLLLLRSLILGSNAKQGFWEEGGEVTVLVIH